MEEDRKAYRSPLRKLVPFFESSRDKWKTKCQASKRLIKRLKKKVRFIETSKEVWKRRAVALGEEVEDLKKNLRRKRSQETI